MKIKKLISFLMIFALALTFFPCYSEELPTFCLSNAQGKNGDEVNVTISVKNNTGIICSKLAVYYDRNVLTLKNAQDVNKLFGNSGFFSKNDILQYPLVMVWVSIEESKKDGELAKLTFSINEEALSGEYPIYIKYSENDVCDASGKKVKFETENAIITIDGKKPSEGKSEDKETLPIFPNMNPDASGFSNFKKINQSSPSTFKDILSSDWFYLEVLKSYEYGLMVGKGEEKFAPNEKITLAEGITLASRLNDTYFNKKSDFTSPNNMPWYSAYVNYAKENDIYSEQKFGTDFNKILTRAETVLLLSSALPIECFKKINEIKIIPDVANNTDSEPIYRLYRAGIITGNDEYGTFSGDLSVKRCEVSAILNRLVNIDSRIIFEPKS